MRGSPRLWFVAGRLLVTQAGRYWSISRDRRRERKTVVDVVARRALGSYKDRSADEGFVGESDLPLGRP